MKHPLALPPPVTRIARTCPRCGGELRVWGIKRPRLTCIERACGWRGPPPVDVLLRRAGNVMLPGLEVLEDDDLHTNRDNPPGPTAPIRRRRRRIGAVGLTT